eukprot:904359-Rhodomonas_salina.3
MFSLSCGPGMWFLVFDCAVQLHMRAQYRTSHSSIRDTQGRCHKCERCCYTRQHGSHKRQRVPEALDEVPLCETTGSAIRAVSTEHRIARASQHTLCQYQPAHAYRTSCSARVGR